MSKIKILAQALLAAAVILIGLATVGWLFNYAIDILFKFPASAVTSIICSIVFLFLTATMYNAGLEIEAEKRKRLNRITKARKKR